MISLLRSHTAKAGAQRHTQGFTQGTPHPPWPYPMAADSPCRCRERTSPAMWFQPQRCSRCSSFLARSAAGLPQLPNPLALAAPGRPLPLRACRPSALPSHTPFPARAPYPSAPVQVLQRRDEVATKVVHGALRQPHVLAAGGHGSTPLSTHGLSTERAGTCELSKHVLYAHTVFPSKRPPSLRRHLCSLIRSRWHRLDTSRSSARCQGMPLTRAAARRARHVERLSATACRARTQTAAPLLAGPTCRRRDMRSPPTQYSRMSHRWFVVSYLRPETHYSMPEP
jgi:hypothetical protein